MKFFKLKMAALVATAFGSTPSFANSIRIQNNCEHTVDVAVAELIGGIASISGTGRLERHKTKGWYQLEEGAVATIRPGFYVNYFRVQANGERLNQLEPRNLEWFCFDETDRFTYDYEPFLSGKSMYEYCRDDGVAAGFFESTNKRKFIAINTCQPYTICSQSTGVCTTTKYKPQNMSCYYDDDGTATCYKD